VVIEAATTRAEDANQVECLPRNRLARPYNSWVAPALPAHPSIALCETESEVVFLTQAASLKIDALIVLTPQAASQCYLMGLPYFTIEDFFDVTAFWTGDESMLALQSEWSDMVDAFLWNAHPDFREYGFRAAGHHFFFLKVMNDMLFRAAFGLAHLFISSRPREVYYFARRGMAAVSETLFFDGSPYRDVIPAVAAEYGVKVTALSSVSGDQESPVAGRLRIRNKVRSILPPALMARVRWFKSVGVRGLVQPSWKNGKAPTIVFSGPLEANLVVQYAHSQGYRHKWLEDVVDPVGSARTLPANLLNSLAKCWEEINAQAFFREPFVWCGVDLQQAVESRLHYWWHTLVPATWQMLLQAREHFKDRRPLVVFISALWRPEEHAALQAARSLNIPTVTYQHGGFEGNCEYTLHDMTESRESDYRLVYGNGNASYLHERAGRWSEPRARGIAVGSTRLDALRSKPDRRGEVRQQLGIESSARVVLYVPTSYQYNWYLARQSYFGAPYFQLLTQVVGIMREFPDLQFIYKPFPELPIDPIIKVITERCSNCRVVANVSVLELVQASDACIFDLPSTGLLEAFLTDKPTLVFADSRFVAVRTEARPLLRQRATLSETPDDFFAQLRSFLSREDFHQPEDTDREFLRAYGTLNDDGRSAARALDALKEIIQGQA
jgi:hypothetical protein